MNIAFYTSDECCPEIGGTERTTSLIASALKKKYGYKIFSIYAIPAVSDAKRFRFDDSFRIEPAKGKLDNDFITFIKNNNIQIVINQGSFVFGFLISELRRQHHLNLRQIFALHFTPGSQEENGVNFKYYHNLWIKNLNFKNIVKLLSYPIYSRYIKHKYQYMYRRMRNEADKIVLLSDKFIDQWSKYSKSYVSEESRKKFVTIPNALSFDYFASESDIINKDKRVLIVARLDERAKKLTKALEIWKNIAGSPILKDWQLDIVGDGPDKDMYHSFVEKNSIPRVIFYGRQDPQPFYKQSAIFMMTSAFEGFGMTLTEASQFGVVPIAFNTYLSLTDIITDGVTGFVIKADDYESYEKRILELVENNELRIKMAKNAVENSKRYTIDIIAEQWKKLITAIEP